MLRKDNLNLRGLILYQDPEQYCFGLDAVLLAHFVHADNENVLDLGTGNGVLPVLISGLYSPLHITAIELQTCLFQTAQKNIHENSLAHQVTLIHGDYRKKIVNPHTYSLVICNPPYYPVGSGTLGKNNVANQARFEITATLEDVLSAADNAITDAGRVCIVYRALREKKLLSTLQAHGYQIARLCYIHPRKQLPPMLILVEAVKRDAKTELLTPVIVHEEGGYTPAMQAIYEGAIL